MTHDARFHRRPGGMLLALLLSTAAMWPTPASALVIWGTGAGDDLVGTDGDDVLRGEPLAGDGPITGIARVSEGSGTSGGSMPAVSPDGTWVAFISNSGYAGFNGYQVYRKHLASGAIEALTGASVGIPYSGGYARDLAISPDGKRIAFVGEGSFDGSPPGIEQVWLVDLVDKWHLLISDAGFPAGNLPKRANDISRLPVFAPNDSNRIAFTTLATDLMPSDAFMFGLAGWDTIVTTVDPATRKLVSRVRANATDGGMQLPGGGQSVPVFSPDGSKIAVGTTSSGLDAYSLKTIGPIASASGDMTGSMSELQFSAAGAGASFSPDGREIAFVSADPLVPADTNGTFDVYVRTLEPNSASGLPAGHVRLVSTNSDSQMQSIAEQTDSFLPAWSVDGSKIAFATDRDDLTGVPSSKYQLVVKTLATGQITSITPAGVSWDNSICDSWAPVFMPGSPDILFCSKATNLLGSGGNGSPNGDVYLARLPAPSPSNDRITGLAGNDLLDGGPGDDDLSGGEGNDKVLGGDGDDLFEGGPGTDDLDGGAGVDTLSFASSTTGVKVNLAAGTADGDTVTGIENLVGSRKNDLLVGDGGPNVITGGRGRDVMRGGKGADIFAFASVKDSRPRSPDRIRDFKVAEGDRIDLSAIDAKPRTKKRDLFAWIGATPFSKTAGQLRFAKGRLEADLNGDGRADFAVRLDKVAKLPKRAVRP